MDQEYSKLYQGIVQLKLILDSYQVGQLKQYVDLLLKWNKTYSLTAISGKEQIIIYHLLDGLTIIEYINDIIAEISLQSTLPTSTKHINVIDVGSGMGVPGVIIAICCPETSVYVIDCSNKKTAFLQQVAIELGLKNLHVVCCKIEDYQPEDYLEDYNTSLSSSLNKLESNTLVYNLAVSRAFTNTSLFIEKTKHLNLDAIILMKSANVHQEIEAIKDKYPHTYNLIEVKLLDNDDKRYLLKIDLTCNKSQRNQ
ncbi:MAG: rRNA (guanine527-N7)-methyltransferase [Pseudomonadota bacterium]|nr:rRNA (guanine527-N7)-methyltransferase [Pseudomonadota bacterium]